MVRNFLLISCFLGCFVLAIIYAPTVLHFFQESFFSEKSEKSENTENIEHKESMEDISELVDVHEDDAFEAEIEVTEIPPLEKKEFIISDTFSQGDTLGKILGRYANANEVHAYVSSLKNVFSAASFRIGHPYTLEYNIETEKFIRFEYEIDSYKKLIIQSNPPSAFIEDIIYDRKLDFIQGEIKDNLFNTVAELNEEASLALKVANLFAWEINFVRDIQPGDSFSILVEKLYRDDEFKVYGKVIASTFTNNGKKFEGFLFYDDKRNEGYYNIEGENLKKVLLQSPLSFTRVTSGYTHSRKHPIFGDYRPHLGIDYGAPTGTPIMAVGAGTVTVCGWVGGFGKHIKIRHDAGFESMYSHMSRYARGIKKGSKVRQGQVIAYVGSTGNSTGPHLDFRLKRNGKYINPGKAISPRAKSVSKQDKKDFENRIKIVREYMQQTRDLSTYEPSSIKPPEN